MPFIRGPLDPPEDIWKIAADAETQSIMHHDTQDALRQIADKAANHPNHEEAANLHMIASRVCKKGAQEMAGNDDMSHLDRNDKVSRLRAANELSTAQSAHERAGRSRVIAANSDNSRDHKQAMDDSRIAQAHTYAANNQVHKHLNPESFEHADMSELTG